MAASAASAVWAEWAAEEHTAPFLRICLAEEHTAPAQSLRPSAAHPHNTALPVGHLPFCPAEQVEQVELIALAVLVALVALAELAGWAGWVAVQTAPFLSAPSALPFLPFLSFLSVLFAQACLPSPLLCCPALLRSAAEAQTQAPTVPSRSARPADPHLRSAASPALSAAPTETATEMATPAAAAAQRPFFLRLSPLIHLKRQKHLGVGKGRPSHPLLVLLSLLLPHLMKLKKMMMMCRVPPQTGSPWMGWPACADTPLPVPAPLRSARSVPV